MSVLLLLGFPCGSASKNSPAVQKSQETQVWSLGWEDPLQEGMAAHSSIVAWRIRGAWGATVHEVTKSQTRLSDLAHTHTWLLELAPESTRSVILGSCRSNQFCLLSWEVEWPGHAQAVCTEEWKAIQHTKTESFPKSQLSNCSSRNFCSGNHQLDKRVYTGC